ncbi:MAG: DUF3034 family protein [Stellaceae bacterium]
MADSPSGTGLVGEGGKLLATGGVSEIEGAGGGGLVPWALISGYESRDSIGVTIHETYVPLSDFTLNAPGIAVGLYDRVELSYAADLFTIDNQNLAPGGLHKGFTLHQDVFGAKVRVIGDAVYDQDSLLPQIAVGLQYKRNNNADVLKEVGARDKDGIDFYAAATKLFLNYSLLVNTTVRFTKANQFGLLGFGGPLNDDYQPEFEGSLAYLLSRKFAVGAEYRTKPNNLSKFAGVLPIAGEDNAFDVFAAYFVTKNVSLTAAYVDLGRIADVSLGPLGGGSLEPHEQMGAYLSLQLAF